MMRRGDRLPIVWVMIWVLLSVLPVWADDDPVTIPFSLDTRKHHLLNTKLNLGCLKYMNANDVRR